MEQNTAQNDQKLKHRMPKQRKSHKILVISSVFVLVIAILGGVLYYFLYYQGLIYGNSLKNKRVYQNALNSFNNFPGVSSLSPEEKNKLIQTTQPDYLAGYVVGIGPNNNDIEAAKFLLGQNPTQNSIASYIKSVTDAKKQLVLGEGYYQGYIFYFWFGNTIVNKVEGENIPNYGDPKALEDDKNYAKQKADEAISKLKNSSITTQKLLENLNNDTRLKLNDETNGSIAFTADYLDNQPQEDDGRIESVNNFIKNINKPGVSEIGVINADPGIPKSGKKREVGYFVVYLDEFLKGREPVDQFNKEVIIARSKIK